MNQPTSPTGLVPIGTATARVPDSCDSCRAPLGQDQRYCVRCGARRRDVNDPVARYLADASRRTRTVTPEAAAAPAATPHRASPLVLPVLLALVPVAAAIGVMAGRSGHNGDTAQVLAALRKQKPVVVSVGRSAGGATDTAGGAAAGTKKAKGAAAKGAGNGKVLTKTKYGAATAVTNYHPSKATVKRDAQVVNRVNHTVGKAYVDSQKNLPDQIAIP